MQQRLETKFFVPSKRRGVVPRARLVASPDRQHFRRLTTEWRLCKTLETDARERLSQLGRRRLAEAWLIEARLFDEQDTIARTCRKESENAPDYRIQAGSGYEIGAAWKKVSKAERPYLSVILDDPSFPGTIHARLVECAIDNA